MERALTPGFPACPRFQANLEQIANLFLSEAQFLAQSFDLTGRQQSRVAGFHFLQDLCCGTIEVELSIFGIAPSWYLDADSFGEPRAVERGDTDFNRYLWVLRLQRE